MAHPEHHGHTHNETDKHGSIDPNIPHRHIADKVATTTGEFGDQDARSTAQRLEKHKRKHRNILGM